MTEFTANQPRRQDSRLKTLHALLNRRPEPVNFSGVQDRTVLLFLHFENFANFLRSIFLGRALDLSILSLPRI